jgi:hypothetical protein
LPNRDQQERINQKWAIRLNANPRLFFGLLFSPEIDSNKHLLELNFNHSPFGRFFSLIVELLVSFWG